MFTGIVEEVGEVTGVERGADTTTLTVLGPAVTADAAHGDSIAVNGVCLTVVAADAPAFTVDVVAETLRRSALASVEPGERVNLERAATLGQRLGGHLVQGHVDGTATLLGRDPDGRTRFAVPPGLCRYLVEKGSVTLDGVSLTVAALSGQELTVALIPTTLTDTTLGSRAPGDLVNVEVDVLAKYVERLAEPYRTVGDNER